MYLEKGLFLSQRVGELPSTRRISNTAGGKTRLDVFNVQRASENASVLTGLLLTQGFQCQENYDDFLALLETAFRLLLLSSTLTFFHPVSFPTVAVCDQNRQVTWVRTEQLRHTVTRTLAKDPQRRLYSHQAAVKASKRRLGTSN